jgi:hypothetical protein
MRSSTASETDGIGSNNPEVAVVSGINNDEI